jgi:hypothetical protein
MLALAIVAGMLGACDQSTPADPAAAQRAQAAYDAGTELKRQVLEAERTLVERCLARKGFPQYEPPGSADEPRPRTSFESPPLESARLVGYGIDPRRRMVDNGSPKSNSAWERLPDADKQRYTEAKFGDMERDIVSYDFGDGRISSPRGGCVGQVRVGIYGDLQEHLRMDWLVTNRFKALRSQFLRNDEQLADVLRKWSACMAERGHRDLADPGAARLRATGSYKNADLNDQPGMDRLRDKEIELAVADAECADRTGLRDTSQRVRAEAVADVLTQHETEIVAWREFMSKALVRAQNLLAQR